jgi:hypothetical protein
MEAVAVAEAGATAAGVNTVGACEATCALATPRAIRSKPKLKILYFIATILLGKRLPGEK